MQQPAPSELERLFGVGGEAGAQLALVDWARTPLGPPERWPRSLVTVVRMLLTSRFAMWMAWGEELTFFCNDAYRRDTLAAKFPWALGRSAREVWAEIWPDIGPRIDHVMRSGEATWDEALLLFLERAGYVEETYHTFSYSPLSGDDGSVAGMLCVVSEETERVIGERHLATLRDLGSESGTVPDPAAFLRAAARHLGGNPQSLPFTLAYLFDDDADVARLAATSGIDAGGPAAPAAIEAGDGAAPWPVAAALAGETVVVELGERLGALPTGAWSEPPRQALLLPLRRQQGGRPYGLLVAALNRHRALDDGYRGFAELVAQRLAAGVAGARSYEAERRRARELAALDSAKTAFFSNVSHELRTPLTLMLGPLGDALADGRGLGDGEVALVHRNGLRLLKLVNGLLEFSRIEAGRLRAAYRPVDLAALTAELAGTFREATERAGLRLEIVCAPLPEAVFVDPDLWERIVLNLLSNAFKFTLEGTIEVRLEEDDGAVRLTVSDSGAGIAAEELEQLFQRFHRVAATRARSHEGSGIGLALVKELAELHGGEVTVRSVVGEGSRFSVRLPFGSAHLPADQVIEAADGRGTSVGGALYVEEALGWLPGSEAAAHSALVGEVSDLDAAGPRLRPSPRTAGARVLVVDDNPDLRAYLVRLLSPHCHVEVAADGASALARLRERPPDLLISDVTMPGLDGFELLRAVREDPRTSELPVVMLSARAGEDAAIEGLEAGADDYLPKPFSGRDLLARVRANIELARVRSAAADELRAERLRLEQTLDQLPAGVILAELPSGRLVFANSRIERMLGRDFAASGGVERLGVRLGETARDRDVAYTTATGRRLIVRTNAAPIRDEQGRPFAGVVVVQDVTEQVRAQRLLAVQRDVLTMVAAGAPFERTLEEIVRGAEALLFEQGARACLQLRGEDGERLEIGTPSSGSGWSTPIRAAGGERVGALVIEHDLPYVPSAEERRLVEFLTGTVAVAIERFRDSRARARQLAELQSSLLPGRLPAVPGLEVAVAFHPATRGLEVGGDFYDVFPLGGGAFGFVIGDVCGHGAAAAAVTALTRHTTRAVALLQPEPAQVLATVNAALLASDYDRFCTAVYGRVEPDGDGMRVRLASAGHPLPLLRRRSGAVETVASHGTLLGVVADPDLPQATVTLAAGEELLLHTDGLTERNPRLDGDAGLRDCFAALPGGGAAAALARLQQVALGEAPRQLRDDVAILLLRARARGDERSVPTQERTLLSELYPADRAAVPRIRAALREAAARAGAGARLLELLALAATEAVTNVVLHAYREEAAQRDGGIEVTLRRVGDALELLVGDRGTGMRSRDDSPGLGLGLSIISTVSDGVELREHERGGTQLAMRFALGER